MKRAFLLAALTLTACDPLAPLRSGSGIESAFITSPTNFVTRSGNVAVWRVDDGSVYLECLHSQRGVRPQPGWFVWMETPERFWTYDGALLTFTGLDMERTAMPAIPAALTNRVPAAAIAFYYSVVIPKHDEVCQLLARLLTNTTTHPVANSGSLSR